MFQSLWTLKAMWNMRSSKMKEISDRVKYMSKLCLLQQKMSSVKATVNKICLVVNIYHRQNL